MERDLRKVQSDGRVTWKGETYFCPELLPYAGEWVYVSQRTLNWTEKGAQLSISFRTVKEVRNRRKPDRFIGRVLQCLS